MDQWQAYYGKDQDDLDQETYQKLLNYAYNLYTRFIGDCSVSYEGLVLTAIEDQGDTIKRVSDHDFDRLVKNLKARTMF